VAILGINLTNAFLAPYLLVTELPRTQQKQPSSSSSSSSSPVSSGNKKNPIISTLFAAIVSLVSLTALVQCTTTATTVDWTEFTSLVQSDRTYLAFCVDLVLFSTFQPMILARARGIIDVPQQQQQQQPARSCQVKKEKSKYES
jgi:hypothetical protein